MASDILKSYFTYSLNTALDSWKPGKYDVLLIAMHDVMEMIGHVWHRLHTVWSINTNASFSIFQIGFYYKHVWSCHVSCSVLDCFRNSTIRGNPLHATGVGKLRLGRNELVYYFNWI